MDVDMNDAPAEAADAIVVEDAPDVAASPNAGGEDSPGSLVHQGTIIDADIAVAEPPPVAPPAFADEAIAPEDDAVVAPASPQSDENLDDIDGDTAVRDDPTRSSPPPPRHPSPKKHSCGWPRKIKINHPLTSPPSMNQPQSEASEEDRAGSGEGASGPADGTVGDAEDVEEDAEEEEGVRGEAGPTAEIDIDDALADLTLAQRQELVELAKCV
jgi:hypothetical protein